MLHIEKLLLPFDFRTKLFLGGQIGQILGHKEAVIVVQYRIPRNIFICF